MTVAVVSAALLGLLVLGLGFVVSIARVRSKTVTGVGAPEDFLTKAVRAHANAAEYAPVLMVLFLIDGLALEQDVSRPADAFGLVEGLIVAVAASRFVHAAGFLLCRTLEKPHLLKGLGAVVTYFGGAALGVAAIAAVLGAR